MIRKNAELTIEQLGSTSQIDFGYNPESVKWLESYVERSRLSGRLDSEAKRKKLISVLGSFLGECIVRCYGGRWMEQDGLWSVAIGDSFVAHPFSKIAKQLDNGLEDSIEGFFTVIPILLRDQAQKGETSK